MRKVLVLALVFVLLLATTVSAVAKGKDPVGVQLNLLGGTPTTFAADTPFHIQHGWVLNLPGNGPIGPYDFSATLDGAPLKVDYRLNLLSKGNGKAKALFWGYNFANGLPAGVYSFQGDWYGPCDQGPSPETCARPHESIWAFGVTHSIEFVE